MLHRWREGQFGGSPLSSPCNPNPSEDVVQGLCVEAEGGKLKTKGGSWWKICQRQQQAGSTARAGGDQRLHQATEGGGGDVGRGVCGRGSVGFGGEGQVSPVK